MGFTEVIVVGTENIPLVLSSQRGGYFIILIKVNIFLLEFRKTGRWVSIGRTHITVKVNSSFRLNRFLPNEKPLLKCAS